MSEHLATLEKVLERHLQECAERYKSLQALVIRIGFGIITLLLTVIGWLVAHGTGGPWH